MKRNRFFLLLGTFVLAFAVLLGSCKSDKKKEANVGMPPFEETLSNKDSVEAVKIIDDFFAYLERGEVTEAVATLYKTDRKDPYGEPQLLDNDEIRRVTAIFNSLPFVSHRIDYIKFSQSYDNEAKVTVVMQKAEGDTPEATTVFYLKPVEYMGRWLLCLKDSNTGDMSIVKPDKRDSVARHYKHDMDVKKAKERAEAENENKQ